MLCYRPFMPFSLSLEAGSTFLRQFDMNRATNFQVAHSKHQHHLVVSSFSDLLIRNRVHWSFFHQERIASVPVARFMRFPFRSVTLSSSCIVHACRSARQTKHLDGSWEDSDGGHLNSKHWARRQCGLPINAASKVSRTSRARKSTPKMKLVSFRSNILTSGSDMIS